MRTDLCTDRQTCCAGPSSSQAQTLSSTCFEFQSPQFLAPGHLILQKLQPLTLHPYPRQTDRDKHAHTYRERQTDRVPGLPDHFTSSLAATPCGGRSLHTAGAGTHTKGEPSPWQHWNQHLMSGRDPGTATVCRWPTATCLCTTGPVILLSLCFPMFVVPKPCQCWCFLRFGSSLGHTVISLAQSWNAFPLHPVAHPLPLTVPLDP